MKKKLPRSRLPTTGYLKQQSDNSWLCQWRVKGESYTRTIYADNLKDAENKRDQLIIQVQASIIDGTFKVKFGKGGDEPDFLANQTSTIANGWQCYLQTDPVTGMGTLEQYEYQYKDFAEWMAKEHPEMQHMANVTKRVAKQYLLYVRSHADSPSTYNKYLNMLEMVFRVLCEDVEGHVNPWVGIKRRKKDVHSKQPFSKAELDTIFQKATGEVKTLCLLGIHTGLRLGDCCTLCWSEFDFEDKMIYRKIRKTGKDVQIPIFSELYEYLESLLALRGKSKYICPEWAELYLEEEDGNRRTGATDRFQKFLEVDCKIQIYTENTGIKNGNKKRAIVEKGFHSFRHTWVSLAHKKGLDRATVESVVGVGNPQVLKIYTHVDPEHLANGIEKMDYVLGGNRPRRQGQGSALPPSVESMSDADLKKVCDAMLAELNRRKQKAS